MRKFLINHPQRSGLYAAFGLVEGDCEAVSWVPREQANEFAAEEIAKAITNMADGGDESFLIETTDKE